MEGDSKKLVDYCNSWEGPKMSENLEEVASLMMYAVQQERCKKNPGGHASMKVFELTKIVVLFLVFVNVVVVLMRKTAAEKKISKVLNVFDIVLSV